MIYHRGICGHPECKVKGEQYMVKKLRDYRICNTCNQKRLAAEKEAKGVKKKKYVWKRELSGEGALFTAIANTRPHYDFVTKEYLGEELGPVNFIHVLAKGQNKYPLFKLLDKNIVLGSYDTHYLWDNGLRSELILLPEWASMFELEAELKEEYKQLKSIR